MGSTITIVNDTNAEIYFRILSSPYAINVVNTILFVISIILAIIGIVCIILSFVGFFPGIGTVSSIIGFIIGIITTIISILMLVASLVILLIDWFEDPNFRIIKSTDEYVYHGSLSLPISIELNVLYEVNNSTESCLFLIDKLSTPSLSGENKKMFLSDKLIKSDAKCMMFTSIVNMGLNTNKKVVDYNMNVNENVVNDHNINANENFYDHSSDIR